MTAQLTSPDPTPTIPNAPRAEAVPPPVAGVHRLPTASLPRALQRLGWAVPTTVLGLAYMVAQGLQIALGDGSDASGPSLEDAPWMALLHLPYLLILLLLGFGLLERVGFLWKAHRPPQPGVLPTDLPRVCVQLPMFNEDAVAERIIRAAGALRWPRDRLRIQVLDDSTDAAVRQHVQKVCADLRREGVDCVWVHRPRRVGYKAGALEHGRRETEAEFIAIFDADFLPPPDYLERALPHFYNALGQPLMDLALVQAQWGHLNDDESPLTEAQALWVDDHHSVQMAWRSSHIDWVNFTGTAGVWRASAIEAVGGWRSASLVEDCELSVRVLLAGLRTRFLRHLAVPAELPQTLAAYRLQQKRWTQGWAQLQRLHLGTLLWRLRTGWGRKAFLTYLVCISWQWPLWTVWIATLPFLIANGWWMGAFGTGAAVMAYLVPPLLFALLAGVLATLATRHGQGSHRGSVARRCARIAPFLALHTGMVPHHFCAFLEGLFGPLHAEFERTPKTASTTTPATNADAGPAPASASAAAVASTPVRPPARPVARKPYLVVEALFCGTQAVWMVHFAQQGLLWAVLGSVWVVGCVLTLRLIGRWGHRPRARMKGTL
jgi:cellulose synthase/poly-beta-1,6-N-acetylglucosamine synthase-like glycosyltransferase